MNVSSDTYNQSPGQVGPAPYPVSGGGAWKPIELVAMILGFIVFWPIGLAILFAKIWQKKHGYAGDIPSFIEARLREKWRDDWQAKILAQWETQMHRWSPGRSAFSREFTRHWDFRSQRSSGNAAFDDWRESELAKLEEERQKLLAAEREFAEFIENLRRAKDREEFDRFMAARAHRGSEGMPQHPSA